MILIMGCQSALMGDDFDDKTETDGDATQNLQCGSIPTGFRQRSALWDVSNVVRGVLFFIILGIVRYIDKTAYRKGQFYRRPWGSGEEEGKG